ncbi:MAG: glycerol kinase GlpK [Bacilli bacterium]|nr:glycerol kinase GlpK [Bacilli bacterium]
MNKYILSIDQGTTSTRAILFNKKGEPAFKAQKEIVCVFPKSGWVEVDAIQIWLSTIDVINEVLIKSNNTFKNIDSIAITNQRETTVVWEKDTGLPVHNAIVWQSRQSADICDKMMDKKEFIHERTGLLINPYFSASKIRFILDHIENGQKRAEKGELLFGTIDTWLLYKLTEGEVHATDVSNASRTMLFNIKEMKWDEDLCKLFNIPMSMLPEVKPSSGKFGVTTFFPHDIPICGIAGDQQAALFGQACFEKGELKNTYGTGCFMLLNVGEEVPLSQNGLLTTVAWQIGDKVTYALEGSVFIGGAVIQWLRDELKLIKEAKDSEKYAIDCDDDHAIYLVPAFVGLGTPYWDDDARGAIFGITRDTNKNHFIRAALESIAYQCKDVFEVMMKDAHVKIKGLKVDGGATANKYLLQFQSDILGLKINLPKCLETTALGVAYLSGLATGFFSSMQEIKNIHTYQAIYSPKMNKKLVDEKYEGWLKAVNSTRTFK